MPRIAGRVPGSTASTPALQPRLERGASGPAVLTLQRTLKAAGFDPGRLDGTFGQNTEKAVRAYQSARGLSVDGVVGTRTWGSLAQTPTGTPVPTPTRPGDVFDPPRPTGQSYAARGTGYFPDASAMEGGFVDRQGAPLGTLQDYLAGRAPYVSVAMDSKAFPYGTRLRIPELEAKYGRAIEFRVVDTGGAFRGKGTSRIDVCTANAAASREATLNGPLTLIPQG